MHPVNPCHTCVLVGPEEHRWRVGVHQELQVVEGKFLHVLAQLLLLIHSLDEEQGLGAHLRAGGPMRAGPASSLTPASLQQATLLRSSKAPLPAKSPWLWNLARWAPLCLERLSLLIPAVLRHHLLGAHSTGPGLGPCFV